MNNSITIISILIALVLGGGGGYMAGKQASNVGFTAKDMQDAIVMMKGQSAGIEKMAAMMKSSGIMMEERGTTYKDDEMVMKGKDLEVIADKYMKDNATQSGGSNSMEQMMK